VIDFILLLCDFAWYGLFFFFVLGIFVKPVGEAFLEFYNQIRIGTILKKYKEAKK